jgi:hypothetical protein
MNVLKWVVRSWELQQVLLPVPLPVPRVGPQVVGMGAAQEVVGHRAEAEVEADMGKLLRGGRKVMAGEYH